MAVCVGGCSIYLFGRAVPAFVRAHAHEQAQVVTLRDLRRFVGPDYVGSLAWIACTSLVPLLVLDLTGADHAAAFALPWSMCIALYSVPTAFGQSLVAHSVRNSDLLEVNYRRAVKHTLTLLTPVVALVVAFAPLGLRLFGPYYAEHSTATLRLLSARRVPERGGQPGGLPGPGAPPDGHRRRHSRHAERAGAEPGLGAGAARWAWSGAGSPG